jgi:transcriptional regulator with XRE-family HTH domain
MAHVPNRATSDQPELVSALLIWQVAAKRGIVRSTTGGLMDKLKGIIGARIREERTKRDLTQDVLAEAVGIDASRLSRIERGERGIDTLVLRRVARYFDLAMESFFEPEGAADLVLARQGEAEDAAMQEMFSYGRRLQCDARFVEAELARRT